MIVNHELPLDMIHKSPQLNDYDFVLPHLLDQYPEYLEMMKSFKEDNKRYMIMDNSLHELGEAYNFDRLKHWVFELKPNEFIVPDVWEDSNATLSQAKYWMDWYKNNIDNLEGVELTAVVQATSYEEAINCYVLLKELGYKKIAFSYGAEYYAEIVGHPNKDLSKALGRIAVVTRLLKDEIIESGDRIHLLGCSVPQEFGWYNGIPNIESIDTSNPVMAGIENTYYGWGGLRTKPKANLNNNFDQRISEDVEETIISNINHFRMINGISYPIY